MKMKYKQIYSFLPEDFNFMDEKTYENINKDLVRSIFTSNIRIRIVNNEVGNLITVEIPIGGYIDSKQVIMLEKVSDMIEEAAKKLDKPIKIYTLVPGRKQTDEENTMKNKILPEVRLAVNDSYVPLIEDDIIIAKKINEKSHIL